MRVFLFAYADYGIDYDRYSWIDEGDPNVTWPSQVGISIESRLAALVAGVRDSLRVRLEPVVIRFRGVVVSMWGKRR